jgi:ribosomal protein S18 acetylase RimI-like enzyme
MKVRPARAAEVAELQELGIATWQVAYRFAGADYIAHGTATWWTPQALRESLEQTTMLVVEHDRRIIGVGNIDLRGPVHVIWKLYVHPDAQGLGAGSTLLAALIDAVPPDTAEVQLEYVEGNELAAAFYARKGFRVLRREPSERPGWPGTIWAALSIAPRPT